MFVHASMTLAPGNEEEVSALIARSLPLVARHGWTLAGSFHVLSGPTRTLLNLWDIPDANAFVALPSQLADDRDLLQIMGALEEGMIQNELTLMSQIIPGSPARSGAKESTEKTLFVRETMRTLVGKAPSVDALIRQAIPLLEERGARFHGSWRRLTGTTRMLMNLWELPAAASSFGAHRNFADDPEVGKVLAAIADLCREVETTPLKKTSFSP